MPMFIVWRFSITDVYVAPLGLDGVTEGAVYESSGGYREYFITTHEAQ